MKKYKLHTLEQTSMGPRMAVPGGWIYYTTYSEGRTLCFVPDPNVEIEE